VHFVKVFYKHQWKQIAQESVLMHKWMARDMVLRHNCLWIVVNPYFCKREVSRLPPCPRSARHSPVYSVRVLISIMETSNGLSPIL
jgi:hypothetical protein